MAITRASAKAKGKALQDKVRDKILNTYTGQLETDDVKSTSMGSNGEDVQLSPAARKLFPFQIECKKRAKIALYKDMAQAKSHGNHQPLLIVEQDRAKPLAVVDLDVFLDLVKRAG